MTLFDHYLEYMTQLMEGRRTPPEGITLPEGDMTEKAAIRPTSTPSRYRSSCRFASMTSATC